MRKPESLQQLGWSAFIYHYSSNYDEDYQALMLKQIVKDLRENPKRVKADDFLKQVIGFLNKWRCRIEKTTSKARDILNALNKLHDRFQRLSNVDLMAADLDASGSDVVDIYNKLRETLGSTATSKLMHILNDGLFVMWDNRIREEYECKDNGRGYLKFLREMQEFAKEVVEDAKRRGISDPADFLSDKLGSRYQKRLAKFIDEYNWVTITRGMELPPPWHPES